MGVRTDLYGKGDVEQFVGCVFWTYERNGYQDSDWYAMCWDEERQQVSVVEYDTTRCGGSGRADIDITVDNLRKVYRYYYEEGRILFDSRIKYDNAKKIEKGCTVIVKRGRKIPVGTTGIVFWVGTRYNQYSRKDEDRVGIEVCGERLFLPLEYVERTDWMERVASGKDRKRQIRNYALNSLPGRWKYVFTEEYTGRAKNIYENVSAA